MIICWEGSVHTSAARLTPPAILDATFPHSDDSGVQHDLTIL